MISGLGIDIVDLERNELKTKNFASRYMTKFEYSKYLECTTEIQKINYMACIWSLKESIIKATNHNITFSDIEIKLTSEAPECNIEGYKLFLSCSFEHKILTSIAIAYKVN